MALDTELDELPEQTRAPAPRPRGGVRWRTGLLVVLGGVLLVMAGLHGLGGRTVMWIAIGLAAVLLLGGVIWRLPHLRRHFGHPSGTRRPERHRTQRSTTRRTRTSSSGGAKTPRLFRAGKGGGKRSPTAGRRRGSRSPGGAPTARGKKRASAAARRPGSGTPRASRRAAPKGKPKSASGASKKASGRFRSPLGRSRKPGSGSGRPRGTSRKFTPFRRGSAASRRLSGASRRSPAGKRRLLGGSRRPVTARRAGMTSPKRRLLHPKTWRRRTPVTARKTGTGGTPRPRRRVLHPKTWRRRPVAAAGVAAGVAAGTTAAVTGRHPVSRVRQAFRRARNKRAVTTPLTGATAASQKDKGLAARFQRRKLQLTHKRRALRNKRWRRNSSRPPVPLVAHFSPRGRVMTGLLTRIDRNRAARWRKHNRKVRKTAPVSPHVRPGGPFPATGTRNVPKAQPGKAVSPLGSGARSALAASTGGKHMSLIDGLVGSIGESAPQEFENATQFDEFLRDLPQVPEAFGQYFAKLHEAAQGVNADPAVLQEIEECQSSAQGMQEALESLYSTHRSAHAEKLERIEEAPANEEKWDITQNR